MKMIYVGELFPQPDRDSGWIASFEKLGCEVITFKSWIKYPKSNRLRTFFFKLCNRLNIGSENKLMQKSLISLIEQESPVWVHFRMPLGFDRKTIETIKAKNIFVTEYFNDDAFSKSHRVGLHWKFRHALSSYDGHFVWRKRDINIYKRAGAKHVQHSPPYYDPEKNFISKNFSPPEVYLADVAFIGHWENDWRVECLEALKMSGKKVIIKGGGNLWNSALRGTKLSELIPIVEAYDSEYRHIYANVIAGLCFFSKINNDTWTRRALEIVAIGGVLVCERTDEAKHYFRDSKEAFFFSSIEELIDIVDKLKANPEMRERVRRAGYKKLVSGKNTIFDRANDVYKYVVSNKI